tara:strand:+ start:125 stop:304 length:180 start_codon:yes stop_codon:yes gene_type:complete
MANNNLQMSDEFGSPRHRRRKMQRLLKKNPGLLERLTKQMLLNGWRPEGYGESPEASDE